MRALISLLGLAALFGLIGFGGLVASEADWTAIQAEVLNASTSAWAHLRAGSVDPMVLLPALGWGVGLLAAFVLLSGLMGLVGGMLLGGFKKGLQRGNAPQQPRGPSLGGKAVSLPWRVTAGRRKAGLIALTQVLGRGIPAMQAWEGTPANDRNVIATLSVEALVLKGTARQDACTLVHGALGATHAPPKAKPEAVPAKKGTAKAKLGFLARLQAATRLLLTGEAPKKAATPRKRKTAEPTPEQPPATPETADAAALELAPATPAEPAQAEPAPPVVVAGASVTVNVASAPPAPEPVPPPAAKPTAEEPPVPDPADDKGRYRGKGKGR